jgi:hypothetical protein
MGGTRIDDHSNWIGSSSKESPLPMNSKMKQYSSAEGSGAVSKYEDTTETIKEQQNMNISKAKSHGMKPGYRN